MILNYSPGLLYLDNEARISKSEITLRPGGSIFWVLAPVERAMCITDALISQGV